MSFRTQLVVRKNCSATYKFALFLLGPPNYKEQPNNSSPKIWRLFFSPLSRVSAEQTISGFPRSRKGGVVKKKVGPWRAFLLLLFMNSTRYTPAERSERGQTMLTDCRGEVLASQLSSCVAVSRASLPFSPAAREKRQFKQNLLALQPEKFHVMNTIRLFTNIFLNLVQISDAQNRMESQS